MGVGVYIFVCPCVQVTSVQVGMSKSTMSCTCIYTTCIHVPQFPWRSQQPVELLPPPLLAVFSTDLPHRSHHAALHTHTLTHTHTHTHTHLLSHTHTHTHSFTHTHTRTHTRTHARSLTHSHTHSLTHTLTVQVSTPPPYCITSTAHTTLTNSLHCPGIREVICHDFPEFREVPAVPLPTAHVVVVQLLIQVI